MKKLITAATLAAVLLTFFVIPASAARGFSISAEYGTPVIDGKADDIWDNCTTSAEVKYLFSDGIAAADENAVVRVMYDKDNIYFLVEATDKELNDKEIFEFYIDEAFDKSTGFNKNDRQSRIVVKDGSISIANVKDNEGNNNGREHLFNKAVSTKTANGWILEASFKWAGHVSLAAGSEIGIEFMWDTGDGRAYRWNVESHKGDAKPFQSTDNFARCILQKEIKKPAAAETPTTAPETFDPITALVVTAVISGAGVVAFGKKRR